jgi:hypothetical protein
MGFQDPTEEAKISRGKRNNQRKNQRKKLMPGKHTKERSHYARYQGSELAKFFSGGL